MTIASPTIAAGVQAILDVLRAHEDELRCAGIRSLSLFGSVARGDAEEGSDVDVTVEIDPNAQIGLLQLIALERRLGEIIGRKVDLISEPVEKDRLQANIDRDRLRVF